jgi:ribosomal protein S18 acetylase RimI-like enzyme
MRSDHSRDELALAPVRREELDAVAALHTRAFADSAITAFGLGAILRYYQWLLDGPHDAVLMGAWRGERLLGFCAAGVFRGAMSGFLRAHRNYLATRVLLHPSLLLSPLIRDRVKQAVVITARFSRMRRRPQVEAAPAPQFGVLSIATDPDARGAGAGRALMLEAETRARAGGFKRMVLTVHPENTRAVRFYEQLGWNRRLTEAVWSGAMHKELG